MIAKLILPSFTINNAKKKGMLKLSNSYHYKSIKKLGYLFICGKIKLNSFLLDHENFMNISDATLLARSGKKVYGAKKLMNYVTKSY
ncbi:MAG: hypothetical protein FIB08_01615, partial [Candidatus Methanoperedens sp.]|nr:hypothetical protein [Candidatus Methanoperedens sp.]